MPVHCRVIPSIWFSGTHLYTWVERGTVRVKCLAQEHNTVFPARAQAWTFQYGLKGTNHEATKPLIQTSQGEKIQLKTWEIQEIWVKVAVFDWGKGNHISFKLLGGLKNQEFEKSRDHCTRKTIIYFMKRIRSVPGNMTLPRIISPNMHPIDHTSTFSL